MRNEGKKRTLLFKCVRGKEKTRRHTHTICLLFYYSFPFSLGTCIHVINKRRRTPTKNFLVLLLSLVFILLLHSIEIIRAEDVLSRKFAELIADRIQLICLSFSLFCYSLRFSLILLRLFIVLNHIIPY